MAEFKPATVRGAGGVIPSRVPSHARAEPRPSTQQPPPLQDRTLFDQGVDFAPVPEMVADFAAPSARVASWLTDPRLTATLKAASETLAPNGAAQDATDRYAASVIETHLVARRQLTKLTNALLKT